MPHHETIALSGVVQHVFAHRFTLQSGDQTHLADLGPKGVEAFPLIAGALVTLEGERRPSEIKVTRIGAEGRDPVRIEHKKPHHGPGPAPARSDAAADPARALSAVIRAGWAVTGEPRRRPKHFEVLARQGEGEWRELHVDFAGSIYKQKLADLAKWGRRD